MQGQVRFHQYGRNAVLEGKGEIPVSQIVPLLLKNEREAKEMINEGWDHVLYGMKKYGQGGELRGMDFMLVPMNEKQFRFVAKKCRNVMIYALHRR